MTDGIIIFSRMSSTRLPGKALKEIHGRPLLGHVIDRSRLVGPDYKVIVATSEQEDDDAIAKYAEQQGVDVYRGELDNVALRALSCAHDYELENFARVCGDRPFFDPTIVAKLFELRSQTNASLATNVIGKTFPPGMTAEVISTQALEIALPKMKNIDDYEHVTRFFYTHASEFHIENITSEHPEFANMSFVVDTEHDLERASFIANKLADRVMIADMNEVINVATQWYMLFNSRTTQQ